MRKTGKTSSIICLLVMVCIFVMGVSIRPQAADARKKYTIACVFQVAMIDFFVPTRIGAIDAGREYGVDVKWMGPPDMSGPSVISMLETMLVKGVDGLVVEALDPNILIPIVKKAHAMGVPVVLTNELIEHEVFDGYCGADGIAVGKLMGEQMALVMQGKGPWAQKVGYKGGKVAGKVAYTSDAPGSLNLEKRIKGARDYLSQYPGIIDVGKYDSTLSIEKGQEVVTNIITANPDLKGIIPVGSGPTVAAAMAVRGRRLKGKVIIVGMDLLPQTLKLVQDHVIASIIGQNPYGQGYLPVKAIAEYLINKKPIPKFLPTKLEVVDLTNVDQIYKREMDYLERGSRLK